MPSITDNMSHPDGCSNANAKMGGQQLDQQSDALSHRCTFEQQDYLPTCDVVAVTNLCHQPYGVVINEGSYF